MVDLCQPLHTVLKNLCVLAAFVLTLLHFQESLKKVFFFPQWRIACLRKRLISKQVGCTQGWRRRDNLSQGWTLSNTKCWVQLGLKTSESKAESALFCVSKKAECAKNLCFSVQEWKVFCACLQTWVEQKAEQNPMFSRQMQESSLWRLLDWLKACMCPDGFCPLDFILEVFCHALKCFLILLWQSGAHSVFPTVLWSAVFEEWVFCIQHINTHHLWGLLNADWSWKTFESFQVGFNLESKAFISTHRSTIRGLGCPVCTLGLNCSKSKNKWIGFWCHKAIHLSYRRTTERKKQRKTKR